ncbi:unnamed protein product, partial [Chrysoparadoxa australica]
MRYAILSVCECVHSCALQSWGNLEDQILGEISMVSYHHGPNHTL